MASWKVVFKRVLENLGTEGKTVDNDAHHCKRQECNRLILCFPSLEYEALLIHVSGNTFLPRKKKK